MGPFEAFYASPLQHPILLWLAAIVGLFVCVTRPGLDVRVRRYGIALVALSLLDAWLTSNHVYGIGTLAGRAASLVPLFFVLAGDFRYLLLVESARDPGTLAIRGRCVLGALGLTLVVPLFAQAVLAVLPEAASGPRVLFFVYEVAFLLLVMALLRWHPNARSVRWLAPVHRFVLLYYGLWASADALLLATGSDLGFLLRVVPNVLYYGGLTAVIGWSAAAPGPGGASARR